MQLPGPPPLASLWERVLRAQSLPPDLDVERLYVAIRDRLVHPEWEVRLHALRVLADVLPLSGNALAFPFDQVVDNLGHGSPNVRKAALDALKVFCAHCEDPDCAARALLDKCAYRNIRPHSADVDAKANVITGLILSIPSVLGILKRRAPSLEILPIFHVLGDKLFDPAHRDVTLRSLVKLRRVCGPRDYMRTLSQLDPRIQDEFRILCDNYDDDSSDVYYSTSRRTNHAISIPGRFSTDSSSEDSYGARREDATGYNGYAKVIIETEIKFDSDTAITMTVLEENAESDRTITSEDDCDSSDRNMLQYSDDSEDADVVVHKRVRFGGESVKIRTPDSDNILNSEDDKVNVDRPTDTSVTQTTQAKLENETMQTKLKKSGIPLPVIQIKTRPPVTSCKIKRIVKQKSKSLSELYDYFRNRNDVVSQSNHVSRGLGFALTLTEVRTPDRTTSPIQEHRQVEVLHNLQRSPVSSPRRRHSTLLLEHDGYVLNVLSKSPPEQGLLSPRPASPLRGRYDWETTGILPQHVVDQLHNAENWISAVRAADQLHSALLKPDNVAKVEATALSLVEHMWALSEAVPSCRAPAEGAVCALLRGCSDECARALLPALITRLTMSPSPAALPHALLQRLALHHLIDLVFDPDVVKISGDSERAQSGQLRAALCVSRAAGPAAVLAAVRRRLAGTTRADLFCHKLRELLNRPIDKEHTKLNQASRSQLPVAVRRRARSTPPPAPSLPPRRLRPLPDSAPLPGISYVPKDLLSKPVFPIPLCDSDSSALTAHDEADPEKEDEAKSEKLDKSGANSTFDARSADVPFEDEEAVGTPARAPRSPSILVEDCSGRSLAGSYGEATASVSPQRSEHSVHSVNVDSLFGSQKSLHTPPNESPGAPSRASGRSSSPGPRGSVSPDVSCGSEHASPCERDVRAALAECTVPARNEDWEVIVKRLLEVERLAADGAARAPVTAWRSVARTTATHVRSLRSRVARTACGAMGALFEHRGRVLDPELEEAAVALLERCADVNRFLRADAARALVCVACGGSETRAAVALARRGAAHRSGLVRAAAAHALAELVLRSGATRTLDLPPEPRSVLLRAAGDLLGDANAETRAHARRLCLALAEDHRFRALLKESMTPARYRAVEKNVDKLRCR